MGSGKTSFGKALARYMKYSFCDTDSVVEKKANKTIEQIFAEDGENYFRKIENAALIETFKMSNTVVSTGGGTPCFFNNMELMNQNGVTIYLKRTQKFLYSRLVSSYKKRPLLIDKSREEMIQFIETSLNKREPFYNQAKFISTEINPKPEDISLSIKNFIAN